MPVHENLRAIVEMAKHDPFVILGFCLVGCGGLFYSRVLLRMNRAKQFGVRDWRWDSNYRLPLNCLKVRNEFGWSAWPVYLAWICFALGITTLVAGLFLLQD